MPATSDQYEAAERIRQEILARNPQKVAAATTADTATTADNASSLGGLPASSYAPAQWPTYTTGTVPTASSTWHRKPITVRDPDSAEQVWVCVRTSAGGYEWLIVGQASS